MLEANDGRPEVPEAIGRTRRAVAAGLALWREGLMAESHRYMAKALRSALRLWGTAAPVGATTAADLPAVSASEEEPALVALGCAGYKGVERLRTALTASAPTLDDARPPELEWIWDEIERLCRFSLRRLTPQRTRRRRIIYGGSALAALIVIVLYGAIKSLTAPTVTASASYPLDPHPPEFAVDGMAASEWLLPDGQPGWLQIAFHSPRRIHSVRLLNSHNRYFMDRATERVRVTAFSGEWPVATAEGRFDKINIERSALDLPLEAEKVTHLRVEVLSYFRIGGGLAEVEVH